MARSLRRRAARLGGALLSSGDHCFMTTVVRVGVCVSVCLALGCGAPEPTPPPVEEAESMPPPAADASAGAGTILRVDPRLDALVPSDAHIEKLADGFIFTEGPVWSRSESRLLFSDVRGNTIYEWTEADGASPFVDPVFEGDRTGLRSISSNGLTLDTDGRLIMCEHGNRRISRVEADGTRTTLVDSYEGPPVETVRTTRPTRRRAGSISPTPDPRWRDATSHPCASSISMASTGSVRRASWSCSTGTSHVPTASRSRRMRRRCMSRTLTGARRSGWCMTSTTAACPTPVSCTTSRPRKRRGHPTG